MEGNEFAETTAKAAGNTSIHNTEERVPRAAEYANTAHLKCKAAVAKTYERALVP